MAPRDKGGLLHVVCSWHSGKGPPPLPHGSSPHFVIDLQRDPTGTNWTYAGSLNWATAKKNDTTQQQYVPGEPTPVYEGGTPGDEAAVNYFIARTATGKKGAGALAIGLYKLSWIAPPLSSSSAAETSKLPCDIFLDGNTPCVAAFSTTRALYAEYSGPLYEVIRPDRHLPWTLPRRTVSASTKM